ncbi:CheY-like superfamily [Penicillium concentricum]|uniref:CheY-like superfamily n=1 Tax=Penicillium concentricum TaxID=293559 RepID=A0A9W9UX75_9EURO|nr:CheY-like superfamily [Penicillium concentricum]KAJ5359994.1 CheY-like superfamily [Penicillium concentricum]
MANTHSGMVWKRDDKTIELRILPLGASITWGTNSKSGNGYRKYLRDQLWVDGWSVDMVGTKNHGNMQDNAVEAHPGDVITQIQTAAQKSLPYRPNVVLINAGANDCKLRLDIPKAGARMRAMIEDIVHYDGMEKTTIILSTLIPSSDPQTAVSIPTVNAQYRELVTTMRKEGMSIVLAEMNPPSSVVAHNLLSWPRDYTTNGKADITHPNDCGYRKMARVWLA